MPMSLLRAAFAPVLSCLVGAAVAGPLKVDLEQARALELKVAAPVPATTGGLLRLQGQVQWPPAALRVLSSPVDAVVEQVRVAPGDAVAARHVLVRLSSPELLGWQREHRQAQLAAEQARRVAERDAGLLAEGLIPAQREQASRTQQASADAALAEWRQRLQLAGVDGALSGRAGVAAPTAGQVAEVWVQPGQRVTAGAPLLSVASGGPLWLVLQAGADVAAGLRVGDRVQVPGCEPPARIQALHAQVDPASQLRAVRAVWSQAPVCVAPGQRVEAEVRLTSAGPAWWLPAAAVVRLAGRDQVFVQRAEGYEAVPVQRVVQGADGRLQVRPLGTAWPAEVRVVVQGAVALKGLAAGLAGEE